MYQPVICITAPGHARIRPCHPDIERVMQKEISQRPPWRQACTLPQAAGHLATNRGYLNVSTPSGAANDGATSSLPVLRRSDDHARHAGAINPTPFIILEQLMNACQSPNTKSSALMHFAICMEANRHPCASRNPISPRWPITRLFLRPTALIAYRIAYPALFNPSVCRSSVCRPVPRTCRHRQNPHSSARRTAG